MEPIKHECGVAMIRLLRPLSYYKEKYGTYLYGIDKLYLLMEKQHNRGQEGAGIGVVKLNAAPGTEYVFRERALGSSAIQEIFDTVRRNLADEAPVDETSPFVGEIYMGHLRYSTTGKSGKSYVHPFLRRNNWRSRNLMLCGNFNMTNVQEVFDSVVARGQHPRIYSDTIVLLEQLGEELDRENHRIYRQYRDKLEGRDLTRVIEDNLEVRNILEAAAPTWDGGYVICGATGSGDIFALRDRGGVRPAFYYCDDEIVVVASERPVIQTAFNVARSSVHELTPGSALVVNRAGQMTVRDVLGEGPNQRCSFERIYFSRGSDADIYRERKALGRNVVPAVLQAIDNDLKNTVFSFIPNTAEVAFFGMEEELEHRLDQQKQKEIIEAMDKGEMTPEVLKQIMAPVLRAEKLVIKDIKLRTFIAEGASRDELAAHVYDVTYGIVRTGIDTIVAIDDSIVRGTTLRQSILRMLDRLLPKRIVIVSSSPQVRYPDCYGIDMSRMGEFIAFRAAVALLKDHGMHAVLGDTYRRCKEMEDAPDDQLENCVKAIYEPFTDEEISEKIVELLTHGNGIHAEVKLVYQTLQGLHEAVPNHPGDWYFSGNYPTPGGTRLVNRAFINFYEGKTDKR